MHTPSIEDISLALGSSWASGINLYATVFLLGVFANGGYIDLPQPLEYLQSPLVISVAGVLCLVQFFADKIPGIDSIWDGINTFIRIPAGAVLASQAIAGNSPDLQFAAGMIGAAVATGTHATKATARVAINTSPEPFSNIVSSLSGDMLVIGGLWSALKYPWLFLSLFGGLCLLSALLIPKMFRILRKLVSGRKAASS